MPCNLNILRLGLIPLASFPHPYPPDDLRLKSPTSPAYLRLRRAHIHSLRAYCRRHAPVDAVEGAGCAAGGDDVGDGEGVCCNVSRQHQWAYIRKEWKE